MKAQQVYGKRLLINLVDELALNDPERIVYSLAASDNIADGFRHVSARDFANAVDRTAWWLKYELGEGVSFPSIACIFPYCDFRNILLILGCVKAGYKALIPSPRNTVEATVNVLQKAECSVWVTPKERPEVLSGLLTAHDMKVIEIAELDALLSEESVAPYPYTKSFEDAASDPFLVLHTSGSTGLPKPIIWKNSLLSTLDATRLLPASESSGRPPWTTILEPGDTFYCAFPLHHGAGLLMNIPVRIFYNTTNTIGPVGQIPTIDHIEALLDHTDTRLWSMIPALVDEIGETPKVLAKFAKAKFIIASGGPVTHGSANKAAAVVRICNITGTTENLFQGSLLVEPEDWIYFAFHPRAGFKFKPLDGEVYEHWAVRKDENVAFHQGIFHTFPNEREVNLKDLYERHPKKSDLWLYRGRIDDMLVMSTGEKIRPLAMEAIINTHPAISACLIVGTGHAVPALLVELAAPLPPFDTECEALIDSILKKVHDANAVGPKEATLFREYIWFAKPDKPFARTDKNTVKRRETLILYEEEIRDSYRQIEEGGSATVNFDLTSVETIAQGIRGLFVSAHIPGIEELSKDANFLMAGVDSLSAATIANSLRFILAHSETGDQGTGPSMTTRFVYNNPSIRKLATAFYNLLQDPLKSLSNDKYLKTQQAQELLAKYSAGLPVTASDATTNAESIGDRTVILTGSTGSLGSYILHSIILQCPTVKKIYCLNRSADAREKQIEASRQRGLSVTWEAHKVQFLHCDLSKPLLGLEKNVHDVLLAETTDIIHNQWPVNFNWDISSFEPSIAGVRHLIDFALASQYKASLCYISSVAVAHGPPTQGAALEVLRRGPIPGVDGYVTSKHISEMLIEQATSNFGLRASICRLGQIAGPIGVEYKQGMWPKHEWFPTILASSKYLGLLPTEIGPARLVNWIPVDVAAAVTVDLVGLSQSEETLGSICNMHVSTPVYHVSSPTAIEWTALAPVVAKRLGNSVRMVSWGEWMDALRQSGKIGAKGVLKNPALKLLDFLESISQGAEWPSLSVERAWEKSPTMARLKPNYIDWMNIWMDQWGV